MYLLMALMFVCVICLGISMLIMWRIIEQMRKDVERIDEWNS